MYLSNFLSNSYCYEACGRKGHYAAECPNKAGVVKASLNISTGSLDSSGHQIPTLNSSTGSLNTSDVVLNNSINSSTGSLHTSTGDTVVSEPEFHFLRVPVLRDYLVKTLEVPQLKKFAYHLTLSTHDFPRYNFERVLDDFVFICFFVGNDFLPHLPTLSINEGALDILV